MWLIFVLLLSSPLQTLYLALSSILFVIAYRISIVLINSNVFHKITASASRQPARREHRGLDGGAIQRTGPAPGGSA